MKNKAGLVPVTVGHPLPRGPPHPQGGMSQASRKTLWSSLKVVNHMLSGTSSGRRIVSSAAILFLALVGLLSTMQPKAVAAPSQPSGVAQTMSDRIELQAHLTGKSSGVFSLSVAEVKRLEGGMRSTGSSALASVQPRNSRKCASDVCHEIRSSGGSGPDIVVWNTWAHQYEYDELICDPRASHRINDAVWLLTTIDGCRAGTPNVVHVWWARKGWNPPRYFTVGARLCNAWSPRNFAGYPCSTVGR
jgi:hypothetical protein